MCFQILKEKCVLLVLFLVICSISSLACADADKSDKKGVKDAEHYYNLGIANGKSGKYQEAVDAYKQAIRIQPDFAAAHYNLGHAYRKLGKNQEALDAFKQAIRIRPDLAIAHENLGATYLVLGRKQEAIDAYKQAIRIRPDLASAHFSLGVTYLIVKDKDSARDQYEILKDLDKEKANKLFKLIHP
jgi:tetratricopeptide (TPR) repeat protein